MKYWLIDIASKQLKSWSESADVTDGKLETLNGTPIGVYRPVPGGFDTGNVIVVDDGLDNGADSLSLEGDDNAKSSPLWAQLRAQRNILLSATDWTQAADVQASGDVLTSQQKTDYVAYRQALRDIPQDTEDPENPSWPAGV
jgi:hypothetical protein